jgi:hypothetical protein
VRFGVKTNPFLFASSPRGVKADVSQPEKPSVSVLFALPQSDTEYQLIFPDKPLNSTRRQEIASTKNFVAENFPELKESVRVTGESFDKWLANAPGHFVLLVGHNNNGAFVFPDGSHRTIEGISEECATRQKRPIFISCQARKRLPPGSPAAYATNRDITIAEGAELAYLAVNVLKAQEDRPISLAHFKTAIEKFDLSTGRRHTVAYVALNFCHAVEVGAFAGLIISSACMLFDEDCGPLLTPKKTPPLPTSPDPRKRSK